MNKLDLDDINDLALALAEACRIGSVAQQDYTGEELVMMLAYGPWRPMQARALRIAFSVGRRTMQATRNT